MPRTKLLILVGQICLFLVLCAFGITAKNPLPIQVMKTFPSVVFTTFIVELLELHICVHPSEPFPFVEEVPFIPSLLSVYQKGIGFRQMLFFNLPR